MTVTRTHLYPEGTPPGVITIRATDGVNTAEAQVTILDPNEAVVTVDPVTIPAGGTVSVSGTDFIADSTGTLTIEPAAGGEPIMPAINIATDATGAVPATAVEIPAETAPGDYVVVITTGLKTGQTPLTVTAPVQPLPTPTGLAAGTATDTTVPLTWDAVTGADSYVVRWRPAGETDWTERTAVTEPADTVDALTAGTEYEFSVKAVDTTGAAADSAWSEPITATTTGGGPTPLEPPANVAAGTPTADTIPVTWEAREGATAYVVRGRAQGDTEWATRAPVTGTTDTLEALEPNTTYEFQVQAVGDGETTGDSVFGPEPPASATTTGGGEALPQVLNLAASDPTDTTVTLTWDAVANATAYHIQFKATADTEWTDYGTEPTAATATVAELTAGTSYDFQVRAVGDGTSWTDGPYSDPVTQATTGGAQELPQVADLVAADPTAASVALTWTAVDNATAYHVQYKPTAEETWQDYATDTTAATQVVDGLTADTSYDFQVRAVGDGTTWTDGPYSTPVTQATTA